MFMKTTIIYNMFIYKNKTNMMIILQNSIRCKSTIQNKTKQAMNVQYLRIKITSCINLRQKTENLIISFNRVRRLLKQYYLAK